jgi:hypothetical protein
MMNFSTPIAPHLLMRPQSSEDWKLGLQTSLCKMISLMRKLTNLREGLESSNNDTWRPRTLEKDSSTTVKSKSISSVSKHLTHRYLKYLQVSIL